MLNLLFGRKGGLFGPKGLGPRGRGPRPRRGLFGGIRPGGPRFRGPGPGPEGFGFDPELDGPGPMGVPPYGWGPPPPPPPGAFYYDDDDWDGPDLDGFRPPYPPRPFGDDF